MPRAIWKGSISFGLVNIPVNLYPAEDRAEKLHFNLLDRRDMTPVRYTRTNSETGEEVPWNDVVKGYEYDEGQYVVVEPEDFQKANAKATQTVEILDFVDAEAIDPTFFDTPYYLEPTKKGLKGYALLRAALERTGKVGIARVVIRTREYVGAVMARGPALVLELLRYGHELRDPAQLDLPAKDLKKVGVSAKEVDMAERLVEGMVVKWDPGRYEDEYTDQLRALIERKARAGDVEEVEPAPEAPKMADVVDLMPLLKKSLESKSRAARPRAKAAPAAAARKKKATRRKAG